MTSVQVTLDGRDVAWKAVSVSRSLDAFLGSATVSLPLDPSAALAPGQRVSLKAHGDGPPEALLRGYVDAVSGSGTAQGGEVTLDVRDQTADLVDGARIDAEWGWWRPTLLEVARGVAAPYGFQVLDEAEAATKQLGPHIGQPGETGYEVLERAARLHGVLLSTTPEGKILLGTPSRTLAGGELRTGPGANVTRYSWRNDATQRFRRIKLIGQGGLALLVAGPSARPYGVAEDPAVRPQREAVIVAQGDLTGDELQRLADWTVTVARARSASLTVATPSWRAVPGGAVWRPGMRVPVSIPEAGVSGECLVASVELTWDDAGESALLGLVSPAAYEVDPTEAVRLARGSVEALVQ